MVRQYATAVEDYTRWDPLLMKDRSRIYIHFKMNSQQYIFHYCHGDSITYSFFAMV